ncbi:MAG: LysE family translocator [Candidatus Nanopelagicales bacterium]
MPPTQHLLEFLLASYLIIVVPGPSVLFAVARAIAWGRWIAVLTVVGNALGMLVLAALMAFGFGPLLERYDLLYAAVQWAGGAYLVWLGIDALRHRKEHAEQMVDQGPVAPARAASVRQGFVVGVLNPKAVVFFAAVFPQFVDRQAGNVSLQLMVLGALFAALAVLSDGSWALVAGTARAWLSGDAKRLISMRTVGGIVMIGLGLVILVTAPRP